MHGYMDQKHFYKLVVIELDSSLEPTYCIQHRAALRQRNLWATKILENKSIWFNSPTKIHTWTTGVIQWGPPEHVFSEHVWLYTNSQNAANECNSHLAVTKVIAETQRYVSGLVGLFKSKSCRTLNPYFFYICPTNAQYIFTISVP
jgi:hypothetical protein